MSYWALILIAVTAGLLFGTVKPVWPWRQRHPGRSTALFVVAALSLAFLLLTQGVLHWPRSHTGTRWLLAAIWVLNFPSFLLGPRSTRERVASVLLYLAFPLVLYASPDW